jgi:hypothetical protein
MMHGGAVVDAAAWAGLGLALLSFVYTDWRLRQERKRRQALGPAEEVRAAIVDMRRCFTEISAFGGTDKKFFLTEQNQHVGERVRDCIGRVADQRLKDAMSDAAQVWNELFASAPPAKGIRAYPPGQPDPPSYAARDADAMKRRQRQLDSLPVGIDAINRALGLLDKLEMKSR